MTAYIPNNRPYDWLDVSRVVLKPSWVRSRRLPYPTYVQVSRGWIERGQLQRLIEKTCRIEKRCVQQQFYRSLRYVRRPQRRVQPGSQGMTDLLFPHQTGFSAFIGVAIAMETDAWLRVDNLVHWAVHIRVRLLDGILTEATATAFWRKAELI